MIPRQMRHEDDRDVRTIFAICHPELPSRVPEWFVAYPTLVIRLDNHIVAFTSYSISLGLYGTLTLYGNDLCVLPMYQKRGLGWELAQARHAVGRAVGATTFIGITAISNTPMIRIFERQGLHACQRLPAYFGEDDGMVWVGSL